MAFDYTQYDYQELVDEITRLMSENGELTDVYQSSTGQVLVQLLSAVTSQLHYMLERRVEEAYLTTAQLESSVRSIANSLSYRPRRVVSAAGTMELTLLDANGDPVQNSGNIVIPQYTKVSYEGYNFVTVEDQILTTSQSYPATFEVKEGIVTELSYDTADTTSLLYTDGYIEIEDFESIENDSLLVYTATQTFYDVTESQNGLAPIQSIKFAEVTDEVYDIRYSNNGLRIIFGDDVNGEKPTGTLYIKYVESSGTLVDVRTTGLEMSFESSTLTDDEIVSPPNQYFYSLTNSTAIDDASAQETITETKKFAPNYVRTAARAVTGHDYEYWTRTSAIGGIVDVTAYGEEEIGIDVYNMNNVYLCYLTADGEELTLTEKQNLKTYLDVYKTITTHIVTIQAEEIPVQVNMTLKRNSNLTASDSEIYDKIKIELESWFEFKEGSLGNHLYLSDLISNFDQFTITKNGLTKLASDWVDIEVYALKELTLPYETQTKDVTITYGVDSDDYVIDINGTDYTYTATSGDDAAAVATELALLVDVDSDVTATALSNVITVEATVSGTPFTISNDGSTSQINCGMEFTYTIPPYLLDNSNAEDMVISGEVELVDSLGNIIVTDDGAGGIYGGTIDYITGETILPMTLAEGTYYLRYRQNDNFNLQASSRTTLGFSPLKTNYSDATELLSTVTINT